MAFSSIHATRVGEGQLREVETLREQEDMYKCNYPQNSLCFLAVICLFSSQGGGLPGGPGVAGAGSQEEEARLTPKPFENLLKHFQK